VNRIYNFDIVFTLCYKVRIDIMLEKIKSLVEFAYDKVPLYHRLYQKMPEISSIEDFKRLPYVTRGDFALCGTEEVLSDLDEATVILPPIENRAIFPFPRMESALDRDNRYRIFYFLLQKSGISEDATFLIVSDTPHSYYCGEIANNLLYYGHPAWMMLLRDHSDYEVKNWIEKFEPDCLFLGLDWAPEVFLKSGIKNIFTINQYRQIGISHFDIYAITELGWIGVRLPGGHYVYPEEYFYIESDPISRTIVLTALESWLQPFIRYRTPDRGITLGDNSMNITYIGEH
jgi:hypothetical protein